MAKIILLFLMTIVFSLVLSAVQSNTGLRKMRKKLDKTEYQKVVTNSVPPQIQPITSIHRVKEDSSFQRLQKAYSTRQRAFYQESRGLTSVLQEGFNEVISTCSSCRANILGRERTQCYSSCMTREINRFSSSALLIGDAVQNFFCTPLGFGFETDYATKYPEWLVSFDGFVKKFNENKDSFSPSSLTETWMSNLLWLEKTPLYVHSYIRSQVAVDIANIQNSNNVVNSLSETPATFADKCGSQWDLRVPVYSLINAAKENSHFLDIILRGLFAVRGTAFYTLGSYNNLAGGILEALSTFIGTKCDIISYSEGREVNDSTCDGIGKFPTPQFPVPPALANLLPPCQEDANSNIPLQID